MTTAVDTLVRADERLGGASHDLGIWTDGTFDYLAPSGELARAQ